MFINLLVDHGIANFFRLESASHLKFCPLGGVVTAFAHNEVRLTAAVHQVSHSAEPVRFSVHGSIPSQNWLRRSVGCLRCPCFHASGYNKQLTAVDGRQRSHGWGAPVNASPSVGNLRNSSYGRTGYIQFLITVFSASEPAISRRTWSQTVFLFSWTTSSRFGVIMRRPLSAQSSCSALGVNYYDWDPRSHLQIALIRPPI